MNKYVIALIILNIGLLIALYTLNKEANEQQDAIVIYYDSTERAITAMKAQQKQLNTLKRGKCTI